MLNPMIPMLLFDQICNKDPHCCRTPPDVLLRRIPLAPLDTAEIRDVSASSMGGLFLRQAVREPQRADMCAESSGVRIDDNLATGTDCQDASFRLDYMPIDYK